MEKKYDGFRAILIVDQTQELWTREHRKIEVPDNLRTQLLELNLPKGTVLDGEIWTPTKRGSWRHNRTVQCHLTFWDVIRSGTQDMSRDPLEKRFEELIKLVAGRVPEISTVERFQASLDGYRRIVEEAKAFKASTRSRSGFIHGAVLKRRNSPRRDHSTRCIEHSDWMKLVVEL
jgi:ATP-dependent DNA ligase